MSLLDDITARSAELRMRVRELLERDEYSADTKTVLIVGYVDLALEYHKAIWLLKNVELYGSAFALVRPVFDAWLRALWIIAFATAEEIEQASRDELHWPKMDKMLADIKGV